MNPDRGGRDKIMRSLHELHPNPVSVLVSVQNQKWSQLFTLKQFKKFLLTYLPLSINNTH